MKMVIVVFSDFPTGSAMGRRTYLIAKGLVHSGHSVLVLVAQRFAPGPLHEVFDGLDVYWGRQTTPEHFHDLAERLKARWAVFQLVRRLVSREMQWMIVIFPELDRLPYLFQAWLNGVAVAASYDDCRGVPPRPSVREWYRYWRGRAADAIIARLTNCNLASSRYLEGELKKKAQRTPICLVPPVVDLDSFQPDPIGAAAFRRKWNLEKQRVISYLGTYWYVEGLKDLMQAARILKDRGEDFMLTISGKAHLGHRSDNVQALIAEYGLADRVIETGWLSSEEVIAVMSAADVLTAPKIDHQVNRAGVPAKLAEYLALGRPVVVSRVGDIPIYLQDGHDAILCEPGRPESLANALQQALSNDELSRRVSRNARQTAQEQFDYRHIGAMIAASLVASGRE
jgi:glycosyltransferase involved in cell wall biosynthesis